jgi:hypothetical protein
MQWAKVQRRKQMFEENEIDVNEEAVDLNTEAEETGETKEQEEEQTEEQEKTADPPKQSAEENAKFAEIRRKYETENKRLRAELEAERQAKSERINEVVQTAFKGYVNPYTEKPIETEQDYEDYQAMYREDLLQQLGLSTDYIERMISENPVVRQAQAILETQNHQRSKMAFDFKLAEISKLDPNIKTVEDLQKMPNIDQFNYYVVQKKYDLVDAFKLVNPETHRKQSQAETKDHLIKLGGQDGGGKEKEIPASELAYWKDSFPNDKPAELRARYNRALKRQGE